MDLKFTFINILTIIWIVNRPHNTSLYSNSEYWKMDRTPTSINAKGFSMYQVEAIFDLSVLYK